MSNKRVSDFSYDLQAAGMPANSDRSSWSPDDWNLYAYGWNPYVTSENYITDKGIILDGRINAIQDMALAEQERRINEYNIWHEKYMNNESAKVARERQAGLNPDLVGISDASNFGVQGNPAHQASPSSRGADTMAIAQFLPQIFSQSVQMAQELQNARSMSLKNDSSELSNFRKILELYDDYGNDFNTKQSNGLSHRLNKRLRGFLIDPGSSRFTRQGITRSLLAENNEFEATLENMVTSLKNMDKDDISKELYDLYRDSLSAEGLSAQNDYAYQKEYDSFLAAQTTNETNRRTKSNSQISGNAAQFASNFIKTINQKINDPNIGEFEKALYTFISMSFSSIFNQGPSMLRNVSFGRRHYLHSRR